MFVPYGDVLELPGQMVVVAVVPVGAGVDLGRRRRRRLPTPARVVFLARCAGFDG